MAKNFKIAFDINGNDNGPKAATLAAIAYAKKHPNLQIILLGDLTSVLELKENLPQNVSYIENTLKFTNTSDLRGSLRENTSLIEAVKMLKAKEVDAILSSGDSGLYITALTLLLGRLENVNRPAFMPVCNGINGNKFLFMDVGANLVVKPEFLVEWAKLGNVFSKIMLNKKNPSITLLNIGTEDYKGHDFTKDAHHLLQDEKDLNYVGFSETRDLFRGLVDVAVIDGYGGNLVLKSYEGAIFTFMDLLKENIYKSFMRKVAAKMLKPAFKETAKVLDYRNVGCAWVIGINGLALKAHGSSDQIAYQSALASLHEALEKDLLTKLREEMHSDEQDTENQ
ncbi:phosphate acyltransferase PlsX [Mycoplasma corogypsi]|uniref:phosphate acyltransferase PlsX n=1 Tax=Mycoplasma corogypsi TaxID=2106 RepID=UPI0038738FE8